MSKATILSDPGRPLVGEIGIYPQAVDVRGRRTAGFSLDAGVYGGAGLPIKAAHCWHSSRNSAFRRFERLRKPERVLPGRWLYGGILYDHFGHALTETLSRLWALDHVDGVTGILFIPIRPEMIGTVAMAALSLMEIRYPLHAVTDPVQVEELIVPPQAMGAGDLMGGSPEFRTFVRKSFGLRRDPLLPRRLYISRSRNRPERGSFLGERRLESFLADEGYVIFPPQDHDLASQAVHYASAEAIVGPDGSPWHLVAYASALATRAAILKRRPGREWKMLAEHLRRFGLDRVITVEGRGGWSPGGIRRAGLTVTGEISFAAVHAALLEGGFIEGTTPWPDLTEREHADELDLLAAALDADLYQVGGPAQSLAHLPRRGDPGRLSVYPFGSYPVSPT